MIERMKEITVLVSEKEREKFVSKLRKIGVLHVRHVTAPQAHEISFIEDRLSKIDKLLDQIRPYDIGRPDRRSSDHERDVLSCADSATEDLRVKAGLLDEIGDLDKKARWFDDWGEFDPEDVKKIKEAGAFIRLYRVPKKRAKDILKNEKVSLLKKRKDSRLVALITSDEKEELDLEEVVPPEESPEKIFAEIENRKNKIKEIDERMHNRARGIGAIQRCRDKLEKELVGLEVRFGMKGEGKFSYVQGFCPEKRIDKITSAAEKKGFGYVVEEPDNEEETPTLITNPKWIDIISPVFKFMNTLPGYNEFDISFVFMIFFSVFFAMLIGDAGYGILFLTVTFIIRRKFPKAPPQAFFLMYLLSTCTIIWGVITGTYFGAENIAKLPFLNSLIIQKINSFADGNQNFMIFICFVIGVIQLTVAHLMRAARRINSLTAIAEFGWIMILWGMFFAAGKFVIARPFPQEAGWSLIAGIVLVLFFTNPAKGFIKGALATLGQLPLSVIGSFSDIVSYLRLFAVGYASVVVAESFNHMAIGGGINSVLGGLIAAFILFFGHMLNITLGFMAVIVHGIRLNMLEFSGHLGMQWSGKKYDPFRE